MAEFLTQDSTIFSPSAYNRQDQMRGGGLTIKSGLGNFPANSNTSTVTFRVPFSTKCLICVATPQNYYGKWIQNEALVINSWSTSSISIGLLGSPTSDTRREYTWMAIGY